MQSRKYYRKNSTRWQKMASFFWSLITVLSPKQWLTLFILLNLGVAYAAQANRQSSNNREEKLTNLMKRDHIQKICTNTTIEILNKPRFTYGAHGGLNYPQSCLEGKKMVCDSDGCHPKLSAKCIEDQEIYKKFASKSDEITAIRQTMDRSIIPWKNDLQTRSVAISSSLTRSSATLFYNFLERIIEHKMMFTIANLAEQINKGNCEEYARVAEKSLILINHKYNLNLQLVRVTGKNSVTGLSHVFLVILDKPLKFREALTFRGREKVNEVLAELSGTICDAWNYEKGAALIDLKENKNGLYGVGAQYDQLKLTPVTMNFNDLSFPEDEKAQSFICEEISKLQLEDGMQPNRCLKAS